MTLCILIYVKLNSSSSHIDTEQIAYKNKLVQCRSTDRFPFLKSIHTSSLIYQATFFGLIPIGHTISQLNPVKLSKHSHLYDPGRLIQFRAALHGCVVLHSSISSEQSTPVQPGSKI
jgi:hypothetical protein